MDSLRVTPNRDSALSLWREYQRSLASDAPITVLYYLHVVLAARERLRGVQIDRRGSLATVARWWIPPDERQAEGRRR